MNYTKLFYWLTVADNAKAFFLSFGILFTVITVLSLLFYFYNGHIDGYSGQTYDDKVSQKMARKWFWWSTPFTILFLAMWLFTPSKKDALFIIAGGQTLNFLTQDSSAKQIPYELTTFVVDGLKSMAADVKVDLNIANQKEKILEEAKNMTGQQLLERMSIDSTFSNIILNK